MAAGGLLAGLGCRTAVADATRRHHRDGEFVNPHLGPQDRHGFGDFVRWQLGRGRDEAPGVPAEELPDSYEPRIAEPALRRIHRADPGNVQATWIGHAAFLLQHRGLNVLTDPMLSERASPFDFAGPRRLVAPGVTVEQLPPIDLVVLSHNHYDHMDATTIRRLGNGPHYAVPLGNRFWLERWGVAPDNITELDWWGSVDVGELLDGKAGREIRLHCVPAQHFSGRFPLLDANESLWAGWVLETTDAGNLYFAGDTGYAGPIFEEIGDRLGPMALSLIPIGAYRPRWFMRPVHVNPPEAVRIHRDVGSRRSLGMHWGTFDLTDEPLAEPPIYLARAAAEAGLAPGSFDTLPFGGSLRL